MYDVIDSSDRRIEFNIRIRPTERWEPSWSCNNPSGRERGESSLFPYLNGVQSLILEPSG